MMNEIAVLDIFLHEKPIGTITHLPGDKNLFSFNQEYINDSQRSTLSLSFKDVDGDLITDIKTVRTRVPHFFANLLPEGHMRQYLASHARVKPEREFFLLAALGNDLPGALRVGPVIHRPQQEVIIEEDQAAIEEAQEEGILRFSLAGVQLKFSAIWENHGGLTIPVNGVGGSWIVKLPSPVYPGVPENEYSMMELARRIGIDVPETALIPLDQIKGLPKDVQRVGTHAFLIKRFDRDKNGKGIHIEDFAQVFGVYPEKKYQSANYRNIAQVIWTESGSEGLIEFIRRFVFNALIGNGDMHLKNWSLIYPDKRNAKLAPAYDFVSTLPYLPDDLLALNFLDSKAYRKLDMEQFKRFAAKIQLPEKLILDTVIEVAERFSKVWLDTGDLPMDDNVRLTIARHLKTVPFYK